MANIVLDNLKTLYLNGKQVKRLFFRGKEIPLSVDISFNTNMTEYYYISGQGGTATTVAPPATMSVPRGMPIGTLPSFGNYTYTLSGVTYTIYVIGWYLESSLTTQVTDSWVPTQDTTLYAKWKMTANVNITTNITIPKFASGVYWYCKTNGGNRTAKSATSAKKGGSMALAMCAPGAASASDSYTFTGVGGKSLTLASQSITVNGVTKSVSTPSAGATDSFTYNILTQSIGLGTTTIRTNGLFKYNLKREKDTAMKSDWYIYFLYNGTQVGYVKIADTQTSGDGWFVEDGHSNYSTTFGGGSGGASGACGCTAVIEGYSSSSHSAKTISLAAASGSGYTRTVRVNA